jgi:hypothetical protein
MRDRHRVRLGFAALANDARAAGRSLAPHRSRWDIFQPNDFDQLLLLCHVDSATQASPGWVIRVDYLAAQSPKSLRINDFRAKARTADFCCTITGAALLFSESELLVNDTLTIR